MKNLIIIFLACCIFSFTGVTNAAELSANDLKVLKQVDIPVYPGLEFMNGNLQSMMSVRFVSADNINTIREWYRNNFPKWSINDLYGSWILYDAKPGGGPMNYMTKKHIMIVENINLPQWYGLPENMTTEVMIAIPGLN